MGQVHRAINRAFAKAAAGEAEAGPGAAAGVPVSPTKTLTRLLNATGTAAVAEEKASGAPEESAGDRLKRMADEAEFLGQYDRAAKHHQDRIAKSELAAASGKSGAYEVGVWRDYAMFCLRMGDVAKAGECLRECVGIDSRDVPVLLALASVMCVQGQYDRAAVMAKVRTGCWVLGGGGGALCGALCGACAHWCWCWCHILFCLSLLLRAAVLRCCSAVLACGGVQRCGVSQVLPSAHPSPPTPTTTTTITAPLTGCHQRVGPCGGGGAGGQGAPAPRHAAAQQPGVGQRPVRCLHGAVRGSGARRGEQEGRHRRAGCGGRRQAPPARRRRCDGACPPVSASALCRRVFGVRCSVCRLCVPSVCHVCVMCRRVPRTGSVGTWPPRPLARWLASHERARATHPLAASPHLVCLPVVPPSLAAAAPQAYLLASRYLLTLHLASLAEYTLRLARSVMLDSRPPQVRGEVTSRACIHPWQSSGGWFPTQLARPSVALAHRT